jgi:transcriptional regulator with XRE-family HTH domain
MNMKSPGPTDKHVGNRVRMRRLMLDMTQARLGEALGVTFQQVQKYEKGTTRIGASRLQQIAQILEVPISFFFEDGAAPMPTDISELLATSEGLALVRAITRIKDARLRRSITDFVESLAEQ